MMDNSAFTDQTLAPNRPQYENSMTIEVTTLDGSETYGPAQEALMDHVAAAYHEMKADGLLVQVRLLDTSGVDAVILDLDGLEPEPADGANMRAEDMDRDDDGHLTDVGRQQMVEYAVAHGLTDAEPEPVESIVEIANVLAEYNRQTGAGYDSPKAALRRISAIIDKAVPE